MKKLAISTLVLLSTAGVAFAATDMGNPPPRNGEHRPHKGKDGKDPLPRGFDQLNLTDAQKAKIKAIVEADKPEQPKERNAESFKQKMASRQQAERQLMSKKNFDEAAARQMILERQQDRMNMERDHAERELKMLKKRHAIFQVLTPEQQKQFQEQQQKRMAEHEKRMSERSSK